jgi:arylsulfatase A-like enzyme
VPGINGPTSEASVKNADANLAAILDTLKSLGLEANTDVFVSADHGFSTISKDSQSSAAAKIAYKDVPSGLLPPGFVAIDIAKALNLPLFDPDAKAAPIDFSAGQHSSKGNGLIGKEPAKPEIVVTANGGTDLVYLPQSNAKELVAPIVEMLLGQDYVSGLFVDDALGAIPGTLPLSAIHLKGSALTPVPAIVINFRSFAAGCNRPVSCSVNVADHTLQQGQGMHGSFSRADSHNFMAVMGPSFRSGYVDRVPVGNADVGITIAQMLGLKLTKKGDLMGRPLTESFKNSKETPQVKHLTRMSAPAKNGLQTILMLQVVGNNLYFDAAGFPGRTVGLEAAATGPVGKRAPRAIKARVVRKSGA